MPVKCKLCKNLAHPDFADIKDEGFVCNFCVTDGRYQNIYFFLPFLKRMIIKKIMFSYRKCLIYMWFYLPQAWFLLPSCMG